MPDAATATAIQDDTTIETGLSDSTYDCVVLLQQALEDCKRYQHFARDARADGDDELASFFDELALNDHGVAARARRLLAARL
ncbi:MAG TPA: hypothetical protein VGO60_18570 [Iamia sp.]|nr:hypothetical protein [Iamia sp.]